MAYLFGVHENIDPAVTVRRVGGNATRVFSSGVLDPRDLVKEAGLRCGATWAAGQTAVWSFKPNPGAVASGAWRPYVEALGSYLHANPGKQTVIVIWHEPENDVPKWFDSPEAFVRMFNTVAGWLRGKHPSVVVAHAALAYRYGDNRGITDAIAPRWRTSADVHCVDIYSGRSNPLDTILPELSSYRRWRKFVARDSRWGVTERGWTVAGKGGNNALRAATMAREAAWLQSLGADAPEIYLLWNTGGTEGDPGLVLCPQGEKVAKAMTTQLAATAAARIAKAAAAASAATGTAAGNAAGGAPGPQTRAMSCPLCGGSGTYTFTV